MTISLATPAAILEKGLTVFRKILEQEVKINREQMFDLVNFEMLISSLVEQWKTMDGKTTEEMLKLMEQKNETENL
jgi:hypothetical protein